MKEDLIALDKIINFYYEKQQKTRDFINQLDNLMNYNGVVLYLDEIQNFNKKQQQALLEPLESGKIILIASTTENPHFAIYSAILNYCFLFR